MKDASDFAKSPDGGCLKKCNADLRCGHSCTSICHVLDREHKEFRCKEKCTKTCPNDHPCSLICCKDCEPCTEKVERLLKCGHTVTMACSDNADTFKCYVEVSMKWCYIYYFVEIYIIKFSIFNCTTCSFTSSWTILIIFHLTVMINYFNSIFRWMRFYLNAIIVLKRPVVALSKILNVHIVVRTVCHVVICVGIIVT